MVVKVGSALITRADGLDIARVRAIAAQVAELRERGLAVALVSSGSISGGRRTLADRLGAPADAHARASAAVGQVRLAAAWADAFEAHGLVAAQVLLTADDATDRSRFLNARATLEELLGLGALPVINENDTVAADEVRFEDNDRLAAIVADAVGADILIVLSVVSGLLDATGTLVEVVKEVESVLDLVRDEQSAGGTGGMATKLDAARVATGSGVSVVIAPGAEHRVLTRVIDGEPLGTLFPAKQGRDAARKRWLAHATAHSGVLVVDDGARTALVDRGASLLPAGLTEVSGDFIAGAVVEIRDASGRAFARGLAAYGSTELRLLVGKRGSEITEVIGRHDGDAIVHRDDMAILDRAPS